jgi:dTDP-4-dehydrorhamnose reductase
LKLLITGGSGYLGANISKRASKTWTLAATYWTHPLVHENVAAFRMDVRDPDAVDRILDEFSPNVVIHTAALMQGDAMLATNANGTRHVARAAARVNARLIHLSSDVIFDGECAPYAETAPPHPISPYAESKSLAERAVNEEYLARSGRQWQAYRTGTPRGESVRQRPIIVRTSLIYGFAPPDPRTRQTLSGEMPRLFTDEYRCPIFVDDLADALLELAETNFEGVLNIAGPQRVSRYEFGVRLANAFGVPLQFEPALSATHPVPRPRDCTLDISLAQKILRTRLRGVDQVLRETSAATNSAPATTPSRSD